MEKFKSLKIFLVALIFCVALSGKALAASYTFTFTNLSGKDIVELYIQRKDTIDIYTNYLGVGVLYNGDSTRVTYNSEYDREQVTFGVKFSDGSGMYDYSLFDVSRINTLIIDANASFSAR